MTEQVWHFYTLPDDTIPFITANPRWLQACSRMGLSWCRIANERNGWYGWNTKTAMDIRDAIIIKHFRAWFAEHVEGAEPA